MRFRLDPQTTLSPARDRECRLALADLNADGLTAEGAALDPTLSLSLRPDGGVDVQVQAPPALQVVAFPHARLAPHFRDYRQVIEQLARVDGASGLHHLETLDYAKKLVHDEAGDTVRAGLAPVVALPHKVARRLFTLMFLMASDLPEALVTRHRHAT